MTWKTTLLAGLYFAFFMLCAFGIIWWQRRQRRLRLPFGEKLRLLRGPGETQRRLAQKFDEEGPLWVAVAAGMPVLVAAAMLQWTMRVPEVLQLGWLVLTGLVFAGTFWLAVRFFAAKTRESGNRYLGYFGERVVAEHLDELKQEGWRIFHDVPGESRNGASFNIDHVAVGPGGVFAIETKTRRKGSARPGFDDHRVYFDGHDLVWPWGEDNHGLDQAERNATWLAEFLNTGKGDRVNVAPVLALPGWFVEMKPAQESRFCRVVNPSWLPDLLSAERAVLTRQQVDAAAAKLEARCRDVVY
jgi:hypothetical protein